MFIWPSLNKRLFQGIFTKSAIIRSFIDTPTIRRQNTFKIATTYNQPSLVEIINKYAPLIVCYNSVTN